MNSALIYRGLVLSFMITILVLTVLNYNNGANAQQTKQVTQNNSNALSQELKQMQENIQTQFHELQSRTESRFDELQSNTELGFSNSQTLWHNVFGDVIQH